MTHHINRAYLQRGLPVADPGRVLLREVMACLIETGQVRIVREPDHIDFVGLPDDSDGVAVRLLVRTTTNAEVARWIGIDTSLVEGPD